MRHLIAVIGVACAASLALGQEANTDASLKALNARYVAQYEAKQYEGALAALIKMKSLPEIRGSAQFRGLVAYHEAAMHALLGRRNEALARLTSAVAEGFADHRAMAANEDLVSLRSEPSFVALLADLRARYAVKPLTWEPSSAATPFQHRFDVGDEQEFAQLRAEFHVDSAVRGARDDLDRLGRITRWASAQWKHSPTQMASRNDPLTILREAKAGGRFICTNYAIVVAGVATAYGYRARALALLPADIETNSSSHTVAEVWLPQYGKWVIADGQFGIVPTLRGVPLSAAELQRAIAANESIQCGGSSAACVEWQSFMLPNLFYFKAAQDQRRFTGVRSPQLTLVPMGAPLPRSFAGDTTVFARSTYTSAIAALYAPPR